jgi:hypothetical protein
MNELSPDTQAALAAYWAGSITASASTTRRSIATQLREHCAANNLSIEVTQHRGALAYVIDGSEPLTPGEAADRYLSGGFNGAYGKA